MRQTSLLALLFLLLNSWNLAAEEIPLTKSTLKVYLSMTNTDEFYVELFQAMARQYSTTSPDRGTVHAGEKFRESVIDKVLPLYAKHYSEQDVLKIIAFMNSPIGKKMKKASIDINNDAYELAGEFGRSQAQTQGSQ